MLVLKASVKPAKAALVSASIYNLRNINRVCTGALREFNGKSYMVV
ncbi:MAG TPA: hypothetical protein VK364_01040 [Hymenobacter sp.]|nr:hypothetical protein [Hymenobacter sp.]